MFKFKINDTVQVTAGKDKGRTGKILKVLPTDQKVLVEGINQYKKHIKSKGNEAGTTVTLPRAISTASVAIICTSCGKPTRVGFDASQTPKVRVCHKCRQIIKSDKK
ncbi:50S ribosomal protein L24 [Candidatus Collierbacteria bacterium RIFOXYD1_FULL_40_9]|uniref:Large ribosomal subunit protein uL24 n=1 Tax=Candidatus Collierbacteria bacterium RIFOXYD1_FULL_40_9 TaxID=1817731 RepID=A0A1F5FWI6_9BACT|nr:ribosomal protein L24 [uncultured bacterium]OGD83945.1 MAG: 50S ribosomal protein L24 [Candidatus Collierbacteria bacterium RIFOXYD1_FULL_40_9]